MFWIPIAAIAVLIWLIVGAVHSAKDARYLAGYNRRRESEKQLADLTVDPSLESELSTQMDGRPSEWKRTVRSFMDGGEEWEVYTDLLAGKKKALLVLMAGRGNLPRDFTGAYGDNLPIGFYTLHPKKPGDVRLAPQRGIEMNEELILRVEDRLNSHGLDAVAMVSTEHYDGSKNDLHNMPLRDYLRQFGRGSTNYFTRYRFVSKR